MDRSEHGANEEDNKKRRLPLSSGDDEVPEPQDQLKRICSSLPSGLEARFATTFEHFLAEVRPQMEPVICEVVLERFCSEIWPQIEGSFRQQIREGIDLMIQPYIQSLLPSLRKKAEIGKDIIISSGFGSSSGISKLKLCFSNPIEPVIFSNNEIKSENNEPLKVAIRDVTNFNDIICTGPLSSALIEFFILDGEFDETRNDFNQSTLNPRDRKPPLIIGKDVKLYLQNGVGTVKNLIVTDNSCWMKSKMFCLGAKVIKPDQTSLEFPLIQQAVSQPFRVLAQRGEGNKKHHPPSGEDEIWRLEGIAKDGAYHKNLSFQGINTVADFLEAYGQMGPTTLKKILGKRVLDKTWNMMVKNAKECVDVYIHNDKSFQANYLVENKEATSDVNFVFLDNNQSFEGAKYEENLEVHEQHQSFEVSNLVEEKGEANSNKPFEDFGQGKFGENDGLTMTRFCEEVLSTINFEVTDSPSSFSPSSLFLSGGEASTSYGMYNK